MTIAGVLFFVLFSALACPGRFFSLFLRSYGLNDAHIGIVLSTGWLVSSFSGPSINAIADSLPRQVAVHDGVLASDSARRNREVVAT